MIRVARVFAITVVWSFLLSGLLDATAHLVIGGVPQPAATLGTPRALLAAVTLSGWLSAVVSVLALAVLGPLLFRRDQVGRTWAVALAVAAGVGMIMAVALGGRFHASPGALWWRENVGTLWIPRLVLAGVLTVVLGVAWRRLVGRLLDAPAAVALWPILLVAAGTLTWPDGQALNRRHHLAGLEAGVAPATAPNLVLLSIDALRRDKLTCLDDAAPATPRLDALAARGRLFNNAWAASPWTLPSVSTMHTGLPPRALGVDRDNGLPPAAVTLAQTAHQAGWFTSAVVANPFLGEAHGLPRGFAYFDHSDVVESLSGAMLSSVAREATRYVLGLTDPAEGQNMVDATATWLQQRPSGQPFFLWVHFMEPHLPYRAHADGPALPDHPLLTPEGFSDLAGLRDQLPDVPAPVMAAVEALYDAEVRHADRCVGRLLDILDQHGELDRSWVVVLSDHGEEFFEHGGYEHGHSLMPEVTGVPLMIIPPRDQSTAPAVDDRAVSLLDLLPSLCAAMGWPVPAEAVGRASLVPDHDGLLPEPTPLTVIENMLYGPDQQATLRWPDFRLSAAHTTWFRLDGDPGAQHPTDAPVDSALVAREARALLTTWEAAARRLDAGGQAPARLDEAAKRRLKSLGY